MIGYSDDHAGDTYCMFKPNTKKIIDTCDVKWANWHGLTRDTANATVTLPTPPILTYLFSLPTVSASTRSLTNPNQL